MIRIFSLLFAISYCILSSAQEGQIPIPRVQQMPDLPSPYIMRDWKEVTKGYDAFIFDLDKTGQFLPLIGLKESGYNDPQLKPILLDTYVGTTSSNQAEAINIIPALVGASLVGIDKSSQGGVNWVEKTKDFFNSKNGEYVYLNGYNSFSGNDWWYDVMPNIFFYQLYDLYPNTPGFEDHIKSVADRWLTAVQAMGGSATPWSAAQMNYRAWNLKTMTGNSDGVKEPEAAGGIAWLLYHAYEKTGERKYLDGAQQALEFLNQLNSNPSYELQLPYGASVAAKMNAKIGSNYDISKMVNWTFDRGALRGWGTIVGQWDGADVSGLIGEANDNGNDYAFLMNGFQQAAALVPLVKYDKRFAHDIAKWVLNLSNASRLLYPQYLAENKQDDFAWSTTNDPQSVIGYEALKEQWEGKALFGTGDAKRNGWAQTNLGLYGSSHVGYLGAIAELTNVEGILKLDLNKTDFFSTATYQSYLVYNPHSTDQQVALALGAQPTDVYDAISEANLLTTASGDVQIVVKAGEVVLLTYLPADQTPEIINNQMVVNGEIVDYNYGYDFEPRLKIKSLASTRALAEFNEEIQIYAEVENATSAIQYKWFIDDEFLQNTDSKNLSWTAPSVVGDFEIKVEAISGGLTVKDSLMIEVVEEIPETPVVISFSPDKIYYLKGETAKVVCLVEDSETESFQYNWNTEAGQIVQNDSLVTWTLPQEEGLYTLQCEVINQFDLKTLVELEVLVKSSASETSPLAYYPLNENVLDYSGNEYHAQQLGTTGAVDALGLQDNALQFSSGEDVVYIQNNQALNFTDAITISFWMNVDALTNESFLVSHGSWEERWKVSITPTNYLRWTVKTQNGVKDLDSSEPITFDKFYHCTLVYTGYSMELYLDGELDTYLPHSGSMLATNKAITFGQKSFDDRAYFLDGILDEVRIYDAALQPDEILTLKSIWTEEEPVTGLEQASTEEEVYAYPNPITKSDLYLNLIADKVKSIEVMTITGKTSDLPFIAEENSTKINLQTSTPGILMLRIRMRDDLVYYAKVFYNPLH